MSERFGPRCAAGDKCEVRIFLNEYEKLEHERSRSILGENAELRIEVSRLHQELAKLKSPEEKDGEGKPARKDRWERGMRNIAGILVGNKGFDIEELVEMVRTLKEKAEKKRKKSIELTPADNEDMAT